MCFKEGCLGSSYLPRRPFELAFFWPVGNLFQWPVFSNQLSVLEKINRDSLITD